MTIHQRADGMSQSAQENEKVILRAEWLSDAFVSPLHWFPSRIFSWDDEATSHEPRTAPRNWRHWDQWLQSLMISALTLSGNGTNCRERAASSPLAKAHLKN